MNLDMRYSKTETILQKAFLELLNKKSLEEIFIKEICEKANCSRRTLYLHYEDKYTFFFTLEKKLFDRFSKESEKYNFLIQSKDFFKKSSENIIDLLDKYHNEVLIFSKNDPEFWEKLQEACLIKYIKSCHENFRKEQVFLTECTASALWGLFRFYIKSNSSIDKNELINYITEITYTSQKAIIEK